MPPTEGRFERMGVTIQEMERWHGPSPATAELYRLPGDPPLTQLDFARYHRSNERINAVLTQERLASSLKKSLEGGLEEERPFELDFYLINVPQISYLSPEYQAQLDTTCTKLVRSAVDGNLDERLAAIRSVAWLKNMQERTVHISSGIKDRSIRVCVAAIENLLFSDPNQWVDILIKGIKDERTKVVLAAIQQIPYVHHLSGKPDDLWEPGRETLNEYFRYGNVDLIENSLKQIHLFPQKMQGQLWRTGVKTVTNCLDHSDGDVRENSGSLIALLPEEARKPLWEKLVRNIQEEMRDEEDLDTCLKGITSIPQLPTAYQQPLWGKAIPLVEDCLQHSDRFIRTTAARLLPINGAERLLEHYIDIVQDRYQGREMETPLYRRSHGKFFRKQQEGKDGSETTLLGELPGHNITLRERLIIRHIAPIPYLYWRRAYEATDVWQRLGFSHVPVEPIAGVRSNARAQTVDVFTRVLRGPSVGLWEEMVSLHYSSVRAEMEKIEKGLELLGIHHGHPHDDNFVVVFARDDNGNADLRRVPQVYLIDFDRAGGAPPPQGDVSFSH